MSDIILLKLVGINIVLVHGGGPEISSMLERLDIPSRFVNGLRYTDEETIEIVQMVLSGKTNKDLVSLIEQLGGTAIGMCGIDAGMIQAKKLEGDYGYVGDITHINTEPIENAIANGYIPVIATVGTDLDGNVYNINADTAAAEIATALQAENIITLTDIRGLLQDVDDRFSDFHCHHGRYSRSDGKRDYQRRHDSQNQGSGGRNQGRRKEGRYD